MINKEDIKIGTVLQIRMVDLEEITDKPFIKKIDPNRIYDSLTIKVVDMVNGRCEIALSAHVTTSYDVDVEALANVAVFSFFDEFPTKTKVVKSDIDRFKEITDKMSDTYKRKNHDYGNAFSEMYDELGINYGYGKIREKVNRIKTLKDNEAQVANEPLEDALLDCANYCILTLMEYQKRKEHGTD